MANFGAWKSYHGVESTTYILNNKTPFYRRRFVENDGFHSPLKIWQWYYNNRKNISELSYPQVGNQVGAFIDGTFVGPGSFGNEIYGSLLGGIIDGLDRPIVSDLGGGYGKLAYFTLRNKKNYSFVDFDLPEILCLAAYYLIKVFPDKRALLYGEEDFSPSLLKNYDLIFMPPFEIEKLEDSSIDLFINKNSLGEMTRPAVNNYISHISRTENYFFHVNHDSYPNVYNDKEKGLLGYEYPIPQEKFSLLFRSPCIWQVLNNGKLNFNTDVFLYLYKKNDTWKSSEKPSPLEQERILI